MIKGFRRENGSVGVRNHLLVISTVVCANKVVENIVKELASAKPITHPYGCGHLGPEKKRVKKTLIEHGSHPNVGGVIVVGLGCEEVQAESVAKEIEATGKEIELLSIQDEGGTIKATKKGLKIAQKLQKKIESFSRQSCELNELTLGVECGGSDFSSGLASNPALGKASEMLIDRGGRILLSETAEMLGTEHILKRRSTSETVAKNIHKIIAQVEELAKSKGLDIRGAQPSPGNMEGGLSTIEEKSLGAILKGGNRPIEQVVNYASCPSRKGLVIMNTPGQDVLSMTGMVAGGAQIIAFTTGRGTPTGNPIAPVIKITGNPVTAAKMKPNIDMNVSGIIKEGKEIQMLGKRIWDEIIGAANGKETKAETQGHNEFGIYLGTTI